MINMMSQQRAAERQAAVQQQQMQLQMAQEGRAVAGEARAAELQPFTVSKAQADAMSAEQKTVLGFYDLTTEGLKRASTPEQAMVVANYLKEKFPGAASAVDQTISTLPSDPGQFEAWRRQTLFQSMSAKEQLSKKFIEQNTGTGTRQLEVSEFEPGAVAQELPGSRVDTGQEITYVKGPNGEVIPMPKRMAPAAGGLVGGARGGGGGVTPVATALQTNPGAIRDGGFARSQPGYAGASGGFATFNTPQAGVAAQENLLRGSYVAKGFNTINKIIDRYSPAGGENAPAAVANYKAYVARRAGIGTNAPITAAQVPVVAAAMREFETGQRPTGAPAAAPAAGGGVQFGVPVRGTGKAEKVSSEAYNTMEAATTKYDDTIARAKRLLSNPSLDNIIGNVQGNIPETALSLLSQDAANALSDYNELLAVAGFQELQAMRDASPTGGALGQVSDSENRLLQQSAFASSRTQDEAKFKESLRSYIKRLEDSKRRVEGAYERTFGSRFAPQRAAPAGPPPKGGTPTGVDTNNPLLKG
jgi:type II secretory pathway pseudopilin PulG